MTQKLDDFDRRILGVLQEDASLSVDDLADRIGLSRNACWRRVKNLEEAGVIRRKVALLDAEAVGLGLTAIVLVRAGEHTDLWAERFNRAVSVMPEVTGAYRLSGELDYMLRVSLPDVKAYDAFYQRLTSKLRLSDISASFVMEDIKDTTALPV